MTCWKTRRQVFSWRGPYDQCTKKICLWGLQQENTFTLCLLGNIACFSVCFFLSKSTFSKKFFQEYYQNVKQQRTLVGKELNSLVRAWMCWYFKSFITLYPLLQSRAIYTIKHGWKPSWNLYYTSSRATYLLLHYVKTRNKEAYIWVSTQENLSSGVC